MDQICSRRKPSTGVSEIILQRLNADGFTLQRGMRLGVGGDRLELCELDNERISSEKTSVNAEGGDGSPEKMDDEPPAAVLSSLNALVYNKNILTGMEQTPAYLRAMHFGFEKTFSTTDDMDAHGEVLCKCAHRFRSIALTWDMLLWILSALF